MKTNTTDSERAFTNLKVNISKLKKEILEMEETPKVEFIVEFDQESKKYSLETFPVKFSILENEDVHSDKIVVHTLINGSLYNKTTLKWMVEKEIAQNKSEQPRENFSSPMLDQLDKMLSMRDEMMNRILKQSDEMQAQRLELNSKMFTSQVESVKRMADEEKRILLELSKQQAELEVKKVQLEYQNGSQFWQNLLTSGIELVKENPSMLVDAIDLIKTIRSKQVS